MAATIAAVWLAGSNSARAQAPQRMLAPVDSEAGLRVTGSLLALYNFMEGSSDTVNDVSGVGAPLNLTIQDPANTAWIPGGGLVINADTVINSAVPATKIIDGAKASNELTIEAWVNPANTTQFGPARIVALSQSASSGANFILGQGPGDGDVSYDARLRTTTTSSYGTPSLTSPNGSLTLNLTHVVFTRDASGATALYLDSSPVASGSAAGNFSNWGSYALGLVNEPNPALGSRPWLGELYLVAIYDNALDQGQVLQNFNAGPPTMTQIIPLTTGWNTISSYVAPSSEDGDIFLVDYPGIRLCKDDSGHVYFPELGINTINSWDVNKGYQCYATSDFSLTVTGSKVPDGTPLALPPGWSTIPYWSGTSMPIETGLEGIVGSLGLAKDNQGNVYWPFYEVDTLGDMEPGQGYQIYLNQSAELIYPSGNPPEPFYPDDPGFSLQWGLHNTGQTAGTPDSDIDALEAWELQTQNNEVVVAVLDAGVDYTHEDLADNMWVNTNEIPDNGIDDDNNGYIDDYRGWDFYDQDNDPMDNNGHGTHVSGIIGAVANNGIGVVGVSQDVKIMPLKFQNNGNVGTIASAVEAINYAIMMQVDIMSNSWLMSSAWPDGPGYSQDLRDAIEAANSAGILFVATTGNSSLNLDQTPMYPAAYNNDNIVAVAATDHDDVLATFSNYGATSVDLAAPGVDIYSTVPSGSCRYCDATKYRSSDGTSFATPYVTGVAALLKAQYPAMTHMEIKARLLNSTDHLTSLEGKTVSEGRLNAFAALQE